MHASSTICAAMTTMVSLKAACACTALGEAFNSATGLWTNASHATIQSRAFLMLDVSPRRKG